MRLLIAGIGNMFLGDDGFGVELARRLAALALPDGVEVRDFGIRCRDLAFTLAAPAPEGGWDGVILLDAAGRGQPPGTVYSLDLGPGEETGSDSARPDWASNPHGISVAEVRGLARQLATKLPPLWLVGCEPESFDELGELSAPVVAALPNALALVRHLIRQFELRSVETPV